MKGAEKINDFFWVIVWINCRDSRLYDLVYLFNIFWGCFDIFHFSLPAFSSFFVFWALAQAAPDTFFQKAAPRTVCRPHFPPAAFPLHPHMAAQTERPA